MVSLKRMNSAAGSIPQTRPRRTLPRLYGTIATARPRAKTRVFGGFHFGLQSKSQVRRRGRCEHQQNQRKLRIFNRTVACIYEPQTDALPAELRSPQMPLEHQMSREG
jgi:hypothetical protein